MYYSVLHDAIMGLYVIQLGPMPFVKIGIAKNLGQRLSTLQTSSPWKLRVIAFLPWMHRDDEDILHATFAAYRAEGEWFHYSGEVKEWCDWLEHGGKDEPQPIAWEG